MVNMKNAVYVLGSAFLLVLLLMNIGPSGTDVPDTARPNEKKSIVDADRIEEEEGIPLRDRMDLAWEQDVYMTKDPATGTVPRERLLAAKAYADELLASNKVAATLVVDWDERGPSNVAGRTRAIMIDPNDPSGNSIFAGSVGGGLFKTTNITAAFPNWTAVNNLMPNLAISALAFDPSNTLIMYAGTGEGYGNSDAVRGMGIFKSLNGGLTWGLIGATNNGTFTFIQRIVVTATGVVLACTQSGGVQRSANGGTTWAKVLGTGLGITGATSNMAWDIEIAANGDVFAALEGSVHKSTDGGLTYGAALTFPIALQRVELACAPNDANYVYALIENSNVVAAICRTTNGGINWISRTEPDDLDPAIPANDFSRSQAWYDLSIGVDPLNRDRLFVGGVDVFGSTDGAATWTQVGHWYGGFGVQYVHADQHEVVFQPGSSSVCYFGNDGGIFRSGNANLALPRIDFKGDNYNVTQFYSCAMHPGAVTDYFLAGAQDNGSQQYTAGGINATNEVTGGDGAFCHIDQDQPQFQWTSYVQNSFYRSANGGNTWAGASTGGGRFISPTDYDNVGNRMYGCMGNNNYFRWDNPQAGATFVTVAVPGFSGQVASVTASPNTANRVFFGIDNGSVFRVDNAHTGAPAATNIGAGLPVGYPACVEVELGNDNHLLVCYSNYGLNSIWESVNGGTSWTSIEGNMPDMPVRWVLLNPNDPTQALAATELGVWYTDALAGGATNWVPGNTGLANVRTDMLQVRQSDKLVAAATHGRGLFTSDVFAAPTALFSAVPTLTYMGKTIQFSDNSYRGTSWVWNFGDGSPTSALKNPTHSYTLPGKYNVTLTINAGASTLTKTGFIHVLPDKGTPYLTTDGGDFEGNLLDFGANNIAGTDFEWGSSLIAGKSGTVSPTNAWVTGLLAATYSDNCRAQLWTPSFNLTNAGTYTLNFSAKLMSEVDYDGYRVEYSLNKGTTWLPLGTTITPGWYNNANGAGSGVFPTNEAVFSGSLGAAYVAYTQDLTFLAGNPSVAFRFAFGSDGSVADAGLAIDDFFITGPVNPGGLPLTWSPLQGAWPGEQPTLTWTTFDEYNTAGFEIERSANGTDFVRAGYVNGQGHSTETTKYLWQDPAAKSDHYFYRLQQRDLNGALSYSNSVELSRGEGQVRSISVYPNPFTDALNIGLDSPGDGAAAIALYDLSGRRLWEHKGISTAGNVIGLQGIALPAGTYLLRITLGSETMTKKVTRQ